MATTFAVTLAPALGQDRQSTQLASLDDRIHAEFFTEFTWSSGYRFELQAGDPGPDITKELVAIAMAHQSRCYRVPAIDPNNGLQLTISAGCACRLTVPTRCGMHSGIPAATR